jgi:hypothetical protein
VPLDAIDEVMVEQHAPGHVREAFYARWRRQARG